MKRTQTSEYKKKKSRPFPYRVSILEKTSLFVQCFLSQGGDGMDFLLLLMFCFNIGAGDERERERERGTDRQTDIDSENRKADII